MNISPLKLDTKIPYPSGSRITGIKTLYTSTPFQTGLHVLKFEWQAVEKAAMRICHTFTCIPCDATGVRGTPTNVNESVSLKILSLHS